MTLAGCLAAFMFKYLHPVDENVVSIGHAQAMAQDFTIFQYPVVQRLAIQAGVSGFVLSTALLFGPLLVLLRRWCPPAGTAAIVLGVQCLAMQALATLTFPPSAPAGSVAGDRP
jgi:hypothetical protein